MRWIIIGVLCMMLAGCNKEEVDVVEQPIHTSQITIDKEIPEQEVVVNEAIDEVALYLEAMSIEEKVGQLFMIAFRKNELGEGITTVTEEMYQILGEYPVGGIVLFAENIVDAEQVTQYIEALQASSKIPLFIAVDEEGGSVSRVGRNPSIVKNPFKEAYAIGESHDTNLALNESKRMGKVLSELGFNMDFAPVADIYNEPSNTVIGRRSFGVNKDQVTPMILAFSKGLQEEGIWPVLKHFPGHGNTVEDSHEGIAYVHKSIGELEAEELVPFKEGIASGVGAIMKGHLMVPDVDEAYMVSLSETWHEYMMSHYDLSNTLIITDALDMGAVTSHYAPGEAAVLAVRAGNDVLLMPEDLEEAYEAILQAYHTQLITEERIDESVRKILSKKVAKRSLAS